MRRMNIVAAVVFFLSSCSTMSMSTIVTVPAGNGEEAWSRAQSYIVRNSDYRVQVVSNYVIDTYFAQEGDYFNRVGYTATREIGEKEHSLFLKVRTYGFFEYSDIQSLLINYKYYVLDEDETAPKKENSEGSATPRINPSKRDLEKIREYEEWERQQAEKKRK